MSQATDIQTNTANPATPARPNELNLIWLDMEMTGLDPDTDRIIEVAVVVTDLQFINPMKPWTKWITGTRAHMAALA